MKRVKKMMMGGKLFVLCLMVIAAAPVAVGANNHGGSGQPPAEHRMPLIEIVEDLAALSHLDWIHQFVGVGGKSHGLNV